MRVALYSNTYTVAGGATREILITAKEIGLPTNSNVLSIIVSNCSNNPSIYFVSNTQWITGVGTYIYISNNSSQANITIMVTVFYR